ncbi:protein tbrg4-like isoform 1, partial [Lynx pardinus]
MRGPHDLLSLPLMMPNSGSLGGSESPKDQSTFQKLLHISATAQLEHPEYTGPLLPASDWAPRLLACDGKATPLQKELRDTLQGLLGSPSRGSFAVATQYVWVL